MGLYDEVVEVPRRTMVLFFVVDTSGSMSGAKIGVVNSAIEEIVPELKDISESNADAQIKVATLAFSTGARWIDSAPVAAENFRWNYLDASGVTDLGAACMQLNEKLSRNAFMSDATGSFAPAIFLLSDGEPTDSITDLKNTVNAIKALSVPDGAPLIFNIHLTAKDNVTPVTYPSDINECSDDASKLLFELSSEAHVDLISTIPELQAKGLQGGEKLFMCNVGQPAALIEFLKIGTPQNKLS